MVNKDETFYRGDVMCHLRKSPCGWRWHAYVGVGPEHPCRGCLFVPRRRGVELTHAAIPPASAGSSKMWWFFFECKSSDEFVAHTELMTAADDLNAGVPEA